MILFVRLDSPIYYYALNYDIRHWVIIIMTYRSWSSIRSLKGRDLLWLVDYKPEELWSILDTARMFKERFYAGERVIPVLQGKVLAMIFQKPSTRTRISFEVAMLQLGGHALYLGWRDLQLGRGETIADTARVLSRYVDGIMVRVFAQETIVELAKYADVPVINGLSDLVHPIQAISDMFTIWEKKQRLEGIKLAFVGDGSDNVLHSLLLASVKLGVDIVVASPKELRPNKDILRYAEESAEYTGSTIEIVEDPYEAVRGADVVYTDVWVSMGQEEERERKIKLLEPYRVTVDLMKHAARDALFMHCLPAHRGEEVVDEVIDGPWSVVWDQAENRLHVQKAILALLLA